MATLKRGRPANVPEPDDESLLDTSTSKSLTLDMMAAYEVENPKGQIFSYLLRVKPVTDMRRVTGPRGNVNIEKKAGAFTREDILSKHGSGVYQISFHDMARPRPKRRIGLCTFELWVPGHPPLIDPAVVVWEDPDNRAYIAQLRTIGALPSWVHVAADGAVTVSDPSAASPAAVAAASGVVSGGLVSQVQEVLKVADMLRPVPGAATAPAPETAAGVLMPMVKLLTDQNAMLMTRLNAAAGVGAAGAVDPFETLERQAALFERLGWSKPGAAAGGVPAAAPAAGEGDLTGRAASILGSIASIVSDVRETLGMLIAPAAAGEPAADGAAEPQTVETTGEVVPTEPAAPDAPMEPEEVMLLNFQTFIGPAIAAFKSGERGDVFASKVSADPQGAQLLTIVRGYGYNACVAYLQFNPQVRKELAAAGKTRDQLNEWIKQVLEAGTAAPGPVAAGGRGGRGGRR